MATARQLDTVVGLDEAQPAHQLRICLIYDCLFPWTVGGVERWMRNVAEALAAAGHEVTYLTRRQWDGADPQIPGVRVVAVSRDEPLYGPDGNRTIAEPLRFGAGVLRHLARHGHNYDVVHTASFPYFSVLAAAALRRRHGYRLIVEWHEVWSAEYWHEYLGGPRARVARAIQRACVRVPQDAFCFSHLHARRLADEGLSGSPTVLRGEWTGSTVRPTPRPAEPLVVFAGRMIREKRAPAVVDAVVAARRRIPDLRAVLFGDGPQFADVLAAIAANDAHEYIAAPGFVHDRDVAEALRRALCVVMPSTREGYGMIVVEASAAGVPTVLVRAPDNAALEHIQEGTNGLVVGGLEPAGIADAIVAIHERGQPFRESTADWFAAHAATLSLDRSLQSVLAAYRGASATVRG